MEGASQSILALKPVSFHYKSDDDKYAGNLVWWPSK